jgi:hypothetical protein
LDPEVFLSALRIHRLQVDLPFQSSFLAAVNTPSFPVKIKGVPGTDTLEVKQREFNVHTRPIVTFNALDPAKGGFLGAVAVHELAHVIEQEKEPLRPFKSKWKSLLKSQERHARASGELQAYHLEWVIASILYEESEDPTLRGNDALLNLGLARKIEDVRLRANGASDDPFRINRKIMRSLGRLGVGT